MLRAGIVGLPNVGKSTLFNAVTHSRKAEAENYPFDDLVRCGSVSAAREKGLYRMEGKEYVVEDGDVLHFRFNV